MESKQLSWNSLHFCKIFEKICNANQNFKFFQAAMHMYYILTYICRSIYFQERFAKTKISINLPKSHSSKHFQKMDPLFCMFVRGLTCFCTKLKEKLTLVNFGRDFRKNLIYANIFVFIWIILAKMRQWLFGFVVHGSRAGPMICDHRVK